MTVWLGCVQVEHVPEPAVPSEKSVCSCPCDHAVTLWVARAEFQILPVPPEARPICQRCLWSPQCHELREMVPDTGLS